MIAVPPALAHILGNKEGNITSDFSDLFAFLNRLPFGRYVFSGLVSAYAPNNAFYAAVITDLSPSKCECYQPDFPWYRNPFSSMHAVAIISLGELASGVAIVAALQRTKRIRGIPVKIEAKYYQKVRGTAYATAMTDIADIQTSGKKQFITPIKNASGQLCAEVSVTWDFKVEGADESAKNE